MFGKEKEKDKDKGTCNCNAIGNRLDSIERLIQILINMEVNHMATSGEILVKVNEQTTIIESVRVLVEGLKAASGNPAELQAIVDGLDANNVALNVIANTQ